MRYLPPASYYMGGAQVLPQRVILFINIRSLTIFKIGLQVFILAECHIILLARARLGVQLPPRGLFIYIRFKCYYVGRTVESHVLSTTPSEQILII